VVVCSSLEELFEKSDCIFGCTGESLLDGCTWWRNLVGKRTLISCSSGDREFQTVLRVLNDSATRGRNKLADSWISVGRSKFLVIRGGFPVNFDGSPESVSGIDIQLTRALLLAGVIQAARRNTRLGDGYQPLMLEPEVQKFIVENWLRLVPQRRQNYAPEVLQIFARLPLIAQHSGGEDHQTATRRELGLTWR
jgi:hypothetical protein